MLVEYKVVGIQNVNYTSKKTGREVSGKNVACIVGDNRYEGYATETFYISDNALNSCNETIAINDVVRPCYDKNGNVIGIIKL